jgi:hypothetical protein
MSQIAIAKQESDSSVYVYDDNGSLMFTKSGMLVGYTGTTVSVKDDPSSNTIYVYDENGSLKFTK